MILTTVPAVAGTVATSTGDLPFEWSAAVLVLVGVSVLVSLAANAVKIWKDTRREPPVEQQIQNAMDRHEESAKDRQAEQAAMLESNFGRIDKKLEAHDAQFKEIWQAVPWSPRRPRG